MSFRLDGLDEILRALDAAGGDLTDEEINKAMTDITTHLEVASVHLAPRDEGDLEGSARHRVRTSANQVVGEVGFTAENDGYPYAVYAHEAEYELGEKSREKPGYDGMEVGNAFLERPFKKYLPQYIDRLEEGVAAALDKAVKK